MKKKTSDWRCKFGFVGKKPQAKSKKPSKLPWKKNSLDRKK